MGKRVYATLDDDLYVVVNQEAARRHLTMAAVMRDVLAGHYQGQLQELAKEVQMDTVVVNLPNQSTVNK